ncbi:MAG: 2-iminoacetate synthase ThiH, partial [Clostridia bacterium]|nr:2-iminoacetate synthase ThiH [Clostridia bacterium]
MENRFFVDSKHLSSKALAEKHRLETDPESRRDHMAYLPEMEQIQSDICKQVLSQIDTYDYNRYTEKEVRTALEHDACSIEDFKALLSPAAEPFLEEMA